MEPGSEGSAGHFSYCTDAILDARVTRQTCTRPENEAVLVVMKGPFHKVRSVFTSMAALLGAAAR